MTQTSEFPTQEFTQSLENGTGRAGLLIQKYWQTDADTMHPLLLHALQNDLRFDYQLESSRAPYLYRLITLTGEREFFRQETLKTLKIDEGENRYQLMETTLLFAQSEDKESHLALYTAFEKDIKETGELNYGDVIVRLDGVEGLLWLSQHYSHQKFGENGYDTEDFNRLIYNLEDRIEKPQLWEILREKCQGNAENFAFFTRQKAYREDEERRKKEGRNPKSEWYKILYDELKVLIESGERRYCQRWGREAAPEELEKAAHDLLTESDKQRLATKLTIFRETTSPLPIAPLIAWAQDEDHDVSWRALQALAVIKSEEVRTFALKLLSNNSELNIPCAIDMLDTNYEVGDEQLVVEVLKKPCSDSFYRHQQYANARDFAEEHPSDLSTEIFLLIYAESNCSFCRSIAVEHLDSLGTLPGAIREELAFDACEDTRKRSTSPTG
jgi:hypothetical protein